MNLYLFTDTLIKTSEKKKEMSIPERVGRFLGGSFIGQNVPSTLGLATVKGMAAPSMGAEPAKEMFDKYKQKIVPDMDIRLGPQEVINPNFMPAQTVGKEKIPAHIFSTKNIHPSAMAHEFGHAKIHSAIGPKLSRAALVGRFAGLNASSIGSGIAASTDEPSYTPGLVSAALNAPTLLDEAGASGIALKTLMKEHGALKGMRKSLPLIPAFASYAGIAGAPLAIAGARKWWNNSQQKTAEEKVKEEVSYGERAKRAIPYIIGMGAGGVASSILKTQLKGVKNKAVLKGIQYGVPAITALTLGSVFPKIKKQFEDDVYLGKK